MKASFELPISIFQVAKVGKDGHAMKIVARFGNPGVWEKGERFELFFEQNGEPYIIEGKGSDHPGKKFPLRWRYGDIGLNMSSCFLPDSKAYLLS
jgi:hypothetical protein